jgi:hypothetical protein
MFFEKAIASSRTGQEYGKEFSLTKEGSFLSIRKGKSTIGKIGIRIGTELNKL